MYIVRETFIAKPGQASKLAKLFRKAFKNSHTHMRVMTDFIGKYNTVEMEMQYSTLAEFEKQMESYKTGDAMSEMDAAIKEEMSHYTDMYTKGRREIFRIVE